MSETIIAYDLAHPKKALPMDREKFYESQIEIFRKNGDPTHAVEIVNVFIFNQAGELYIQKRNQTKNHNPGLLDKSIGGHVEWGDSGDYTVMVETVQELRVPSIVLRTPEDFKKTLLLLGNYLQTVALLQYIDSRFVKIKKIFKNEEALIGNKTQIYIGVYDGAIKTVDREASGVLQYSLEDLENEMQLAPKLFTHDLHFYMKKYKKEFYAFRALILDAQKKQ